MKSGARGTLSRLLVSLFTSDELSRFLMLEYESVYNEMPTGLSLTGLADHAAQALDKRGWIDEHLRASLVALRPSREVDVLRALSLEDSSEMRGPPRTSRRTALTTVFGGVALVGMTSLVVKRDPATRSEGSASEALYVESAISQGVAKLQHASDLVRELVTATLQFCPEGMVPILPAQDTAVPPFCLDVFEVTRGDIGLSCPILSGGEGLSGLLEKKMVAQCKGNSEAKEWSRHPLTWIEGHEAEMYCVQKGRRLPRVEEWVIAANMDDDVQELDAWASCLNDCERSCWGPGGYEPGEHWFFHSDSFRTTAPVDRELKGCSLTAGVVDLHGNVQELVRSGKGYRLCGAGWKSHSTDHLAPENWCNSGEREIPGSDVGFRCALDFPANLQHASRYVTSS